MALSKTLPSKIRRVLKRIAIILLLLLTAYFCGLIYFIYFWDGDWGKSIVDIMYWVVRK